MKIMRKGHIGYFLSLGLAVLLTACSTKEAYVAGEQDSPDTYGVYFTVASSGESSTLRGLS